MIRRLLDRLFLRRDVLRVETDDIDGLLALVVASRRGVLGEPLPGGIDLVKATAVSGSDGRLWDISCEIRSKAEEPSPARLFEAEPDA